MFGVVAADGTLTYCNAGHNPPFVIGKKGAQRLEAGGPVVGLLEFAPYDQGSVKLEAGDTVIVFSDGVSEAMNSQAEEFGDDRLLAAINAAGNANAPALVDHVINAVRVFTKGAAQSDDITCMAIRYLGASA
jgi:sigma-B regulation protein RsbU (phosphoserine phosphatase)